MLLQDVGARTERTGAPVADEVQVHEAMLELGPLDREVLALRYRDGLGLVAIAELTETTVGAVHQRLRRAGLAVERLAGPSGATVLRPPHVERPEDHVMEDLQLGITPQLVDRITASLHALPVPALAGSGARRRRHRVRAWARDRAASLLTVGWIGVTGMITAVTLAAT